MIKGFGDELGLYKQDNPLRHAFYVKAVDPHQTAEIAKKIDSYEYTYEVIYGEGKVEKLFNVLNIESKCWAWFNHCTIIHCNVLHLKYDSSHDCCKKKEIEIMKLVGATNNFVRIPFIIEGIWLGILGALIPMILITVSYYNLI